MRLVGLLFVLLGVASGYLLHYDPNSSDLRSILSEIHERCPDISYIYSLSSGDVKTTVAGNTLYVIAIGKHPSEHVALVPEFKFIANMHGDETVGRQLLIKLADYLCDSYMQNDTLVRFLVTQTRLHLMPTMNPDGYNRCMRNMKQNEETNKSGCDISARTNQNKVDLNRNFPNVDYMIFDRISSDSLAPLDHIKVSSSKLSYLEAETQMVIQWLHDIPFVLSANLHGGSMVVNYPFDTSPDGEQRATLTPDHNVFYYISKSYASYNPEMNSGMHLCPTGDEGNFDHGLVNGADWYPISGSMQDYNYGATNAFELTIELGCIKSPPAPMLTTYWEDNRMSMLNFMMQIHMGIKGIIHGYDGSTTSPLEKAVVTVFNLTDSNDPTPIQHNILSAKQGDYYRLLVPGDYAILFTSDGFKSAVVCINVDNEPTIEPPYKEAKLVNALLVKKGIQWNTTKLENAEDYDAVSGSSNCESINLNFDSFFK